MLGCDCFESLSLLRCVISHLATTNWQLVHARAPELHRCNTPSRWSSTTSIPRRPQDQRLPQVPFLELTECLPNPNSVSNPRGSQCQPSRMPCLRSSTQPKRQGGNVLNITKRNLYHTELGYSMTRTDAPKDFGGRLWLNEARTTPEFPNHVRP